MSNVNQFVHANKYGDLPVGNINVSNNDDNDNVSVNSETNVSDNRLAKRQRYQNNKKKKKSIHIIGDSIIKEIKGWDLSDKNNSVVIKTFPGASTKCMKSYIQPTTDKNPDVVVLHCGTNDLRSNIKPEELGKRIVDLALSIKKEKKRGVSVWYYR